jgi:hypothetical protein
MPGERSNRNRRNVLKRRSENELNANKQNGGRDNDHQGKKQKANNGKEDDSSSSSDKEDVITLNDTNVAIDRNSNKNGTSDALRDVSEKRTQRTPDESYDKQQIDQKSKLAREDCMTIIAKKTKSELFRITKFYRGRSGTKEEENIRAWVKNSLMLDDREFTDGLWKELRKTVTQTLRVRRGTCIDAAQKIGISKWRALNT